MLTVIIVLVILLILLLALWLFALAPNPDGKLRMEPFAKWDYAHRGLYRKDQTIPENTLAAYLAAVRAGFGIELDVRLTRDGKMVIHHDDSLKRLCGVDKKISECDLSELSDIRVGSSNEKLPTFAQALSVVAGKVPLVVEIKTTGRNTDVICPMVAEMLASYKGAYVVESFDPEAIRWFKKNRPEIVRGTLITPAAKKSGLPLTYRLGVNLLLTNMLTRPDFIAYDIKHRDNPAFRFCKRMFAAQEVSWTVNNPEDYQKIRKAGGVPIFEHFDPRKIKS